jgi:hypothetical protein
MERKIKYGCLTALIATSLTLGCRCTKKITGFVFDSYQEDPTSPRKKNLGNQTPVPPQEFPTQTPTPKS